MLVCCACPPVTAAPAASPKVVSGELSNQNIAVGAGALSHVTGGVNNVAIGFQALLNNTTGGGNIGIGTWALAASVFTSTNTAIGNTALFKSTGNLNIGVGSYAGGELTTGDNNIDIGNFGVADDSATIRIGSKGGQTRAFLAGVWGSKPGNSQAVPVVIDSNGQLGTVGSSERLKTSIKPMNRASESILALQPATFQFKNDAEGTVQFGLIAEEVAKVNPDLVVRDTDGQIYTVRYDAVNAMLLNEFLKQNRKVQEQEATIERQQKDLQSFAAQQRKAMEAFTSRLKAQESQIRKLSVRLRTGQKPLQIVDQ